MYYFIVNTTSCGGRGLWIWKRLENLLIQDSIEYNAKLTSKAGDAREIAARISEHVREPKVVVVVGGDGTMNEVLDGLFFSGMLTLGYIPAGSGNDLARSLRLPSSPERCLKKILQPKYHKLVDYGVLSYGDAAISHRRFAVSAGMGFDAAVCHSLSHSKGKTALNRLCLGKLTYLLAGIKQLILAKPVKGNLIIDGIKKVEFNHIFFISVHIHPYEGGGFKFAPQANCSDGKVTVCVVSHDSKRKLLPIFFGAYMGWYTRRKGIRTYEGRQISIHTERPMPVHVDGESCFWQKDLEVCCLEKALRMIV